ncbi:MAG TPA: FAD-dependent oxidoreductase [Coriobacteriia bacterium]|jgi:ferredoxin-NADP reductase
MGESHRIAFRMKASCERVTGFRFDKPDGYTFVPGQYFRLTLMTAEGEQTKSFSHASAPLDPFVEMATRMTGSPFKNALDGLVRGDEVSIDGPYGKLVVPDGIAQVCLLAGGVGVTPARSIIRDAEQRRSGLRSRLFYGNHDQGCIPYSGEFADYARRDRRFQVVHVLEDPLPGWAGERGLITAGLVRRHIDPLDGWTFLVSGPPAMVKAMRAVLEELAVPADRITFEDFAGYAG